MKKFFVTGGSGFIGRNLVNSLAAEGNKVRVFDDFSRGKTRKFINENVDMVTGDVTNKSALTKACRGFDSFIHLAAVNGTANFYSKPKVVFEVAARGTLNAIDACTTNEIAQFIFASTAEVYGESEVIPTPEDVSITVKTPFTDRYSYGGSKLVGELMTRYIGFGSIENVLTFRPHNVYGPEMGFDHVVPQIIRKILEGKTNESQATITIQGSGDETRAFAYIEDVVDGIKLLIDKGKSGNIYHIGNPDEYSINELVEKIADIMNCSITIKKGDLTADSPKRRVPNIERISQIGFKPKFNLSEGLKLTIPWYLENNPPTQLS